MITRSALFAPLIVAIALSPGFRASPAEGAIGTEDHILEFDARQVVVTERDGFDVVDYPRTITPAGEPGSPALPERVLQFEIPDNRTVASVAVEVLETRAIELGSSVLPQTLPAGEGEVAAKPAANQAVYGASTPYPRTQAVFVGRGALRGHTVATLRVSPWIYAPATGELELVTRLRLRVELEEAATITLPRFRVDTSIERRFEKRAAQVLSGGLESAAARGGGMVAGPGPYQPTFRPTADGSAVEYVIVTSEELESEFQRLADWKTQKGVQAVVRTVEWIDDTYPNGVDQAERVRFFLRDAYQNWGTLWVLLAGDTDVVPLRYAHTELLGGESIPADYYFMCLEGNWNADGDDLFAEAQLNQNEQVDNADLMPELYGGRAPVSTVEEAQVFIDKTLFFEQDPPGGNGYAASCLFLAERLFEAFDGAVVAEAAAAALPPWFKRVKLYEEFQDWPGSLPLDHDAAVDSVNNGFGIVHHVGHGFRNTMSVGESSLTNTDADGFLNGGRQAFVFGINCSSASIDFNSIGERWVKNPDGGAVAYFGASRFAFVSPSADLQDEWFALAFDDSVTALGEVCVLSRLPFLAAGNFDNASRWTVMALTLLGDPEASLYQNIEVPLAVSHASSYTLGPAPLAVTVTSSGSPVAGAPVAVWRDGEVFATATTDGSGAASIDLGPVTAGDATLTVKHKSYDTYQGTVTLNSATGPLPDVQQVIVDDNNVGASSGDSDGRADAGETVELVVTVANIGAQSLTNATGVLTKDDPGGYLFLTQDTVGYGTIGAGGASQGSAKFVIIINPAAPEALQVPLTLTMTADQGTFSDVFVLPVRRAYLEHFAHLVDDSAAPVNENGEVDAGEPISYSIDLRNTGQETAFSVDATLAALRASDQQPEPLVTISDGTMSFGDIAVGATVTGDPFEFTLDGSLDPADVLLEVSYSDLYGQSWTELLDVINPGVVDSLRAFGSPTAITLKWNMPADTDVLGYDIYRGDAPGGPFNKVNEFLAEGSSIFEDPGLPPLTRFYYQIATRDSSFNQGPPSAVFSGTTNPPLKTGWPIEVTQSLQSSVQIADLEGDFAWEIFTASDYQYGWHADGTEIVDGDDDPRTSGVISELGFADLDKGFSATTAIGDVDGDGQQEICNVAWTQTEVYLWDRQGQLMPGWPQTVFSDFNWASPVLADLDNDGDLEIIVWAAGGGRLFAWHHDGTEVADGDNNGSTNGVLKRIFGISFNYSSPAVGNMDGDPELEIVFCSNLASTPSDPQGGIWVINPDGSDVPGWPVFTGDVDNGSDITASPVIVNLDGLGANEVIVVSERFGGLLHVFSADGTDFPGVWPVPVPSRTSQTRVASAVPADVDNDGSIDIVMPDSDGQLWVFNKNGGTLPGFPVTYLTGVAEATQSTPSVADLDNDGFVEIAFGDESGRLHAYNHDGSPVEGFPIQLNGEVRSTPVIWDVDNDGLVEVLVAGWDENVYVWDLPFLWRPDVSPWPFFRHDQWNTGSFDQPVQIAVADDPAASPTIARAVVHPPFPNPFNPRTRFAYEVPGDRASRVDIAVYDVNGRLVRRLVQGLVDPGQYSVEWDGRTMSGRTATTGVYFYRAQIGDFRTAGKLTMVK